jgi:transposase
MKLLVYERLLNPGSKKRAYDNRGNYFDGMDFSLADVYRSLSHICKQEEALQLWIHERITENQGRNMEHMYYDVTNYYFEIDKTDEMRKKGVSKEHRPNPIIQMGLFMDSNGLPVSYELFPGNTNDCETLIPTLKRLKRDYDTGRIIVVADKGMSTADNCYYNIHTLKNGYVFSRTVRGADAEMKKYVLDDRGYTVTRNEAGEIKYKIKSRLYPRQIEIEGADKKKVKRVLDEKQVVFYSLDYDKKAKEDRANAVTKARNFEENPDKYKSATNHGAAKYIKNIEYDKKTGEVMLTGKIPTFDEAKLKEEEKYDGYYVIVTSEHEKTNDEIIDIYRGLWKIEESFRVTKSDLETRPVYVTREDRIRAHFLTCFVALVIARLLQQKLNNQYSVTRLIESLSKLSCSHIKENYYLFDYADEVTDAVGRALDIDFGRKYMTLKDIKGSLAATKKH